MRNLIWLHILACGMLACTPDPKEGERNSGTVNIPGQNESPITRHADTTASMKDGATPDGVAPQDNTQSNEGSKTSGAAGQ